MNVVGEEHVRDAFRRGRRKLVVANDDIVTPQALDALERLGLQVIRGPLEKPAPFGADPAVRSDAACIGEAHAGSRPTGRAA